MYPKIESTPEYQEKTQTISDGIETNRISEMERNIKEMETKLSYSKRKLEELKLVEMYKVEFGDKSTDDFFFESEALKEMYFTARHTHKLGYMWNAYSDDAKGFLEKIREKNCDAIIELIIHPCDKDMDDPQHMFYIGNISGFKKIIDGTHELVYEENPDMDGNDWWCQYDDAECDSENGVNIYEEREVDELIFTGVRDYLDTRGQKQVTL